MQPVFQLLDEYVFPLGCGLWRIKRAPWPPSVKWPCRKIDCCTCKRPLGKQHGIMILMGAHIPTRGQGIHPQLVYTDQQLAAEIQELERIAGIPVTIIPAHTEPFKDSLKNSLQCCKPRCLVFTGQWGEKEYVYLASHEGLCGPLRVTCDDIVDVIVQHNETCEAPVLMVFVLTCQEFLRHARCSCD
eukprot:3428114-Amphidinium_carterae.1